MVELRSPKSDWCIKLHLHLVLLVKRGTTVGTRVLGGGGRGSGFFKDHEAKSIIFIWSAFSAWWGYIKPSSLIFGFAVNFVYNSVCYNLQEYEANEMQSVRKARHTSKQRNYKASYNDMLSCKSCGFKTMFEHRLLSHECVEASHHLKVRIVLRLALLME